MQRSSIILLGHLCLICLILACSNSNEFSIEGSFKSVDPTPVRLYILNEEGAELVDSVYAGENKFSLGGIAENTNIYMLKFFNDQLIYLVIRPGDKIVLDIDNTLEEIAYFVAHSPDSKKIKELVGEQNKLLKKINRLSHSWEENPGDSALRKIIDSTYFALVQNHQEYTRNFIYQNPESLANIMALYQNIGEKGRQLFDRYEDVDIFNFVDSCLTAIYPNSYSVLSLNKYLNEIKEQIAQKTLIEKEVDVGYPLPRLVAPTITGDSIETGNDDLHTLLLFWASWNPYSVNELLGIKSFLEANPRLANKLMFVAVSLDSSPEHLKNFVDEQRISFPVICDYQYWDSDYIARFAVKRIPSVLFANDEGRVIARDIFGNELLTRINETID